MRTIKNNQKILRTYSYVLREKPSQYQYLIGFVKVLHNFLYLEEKFFDLVKSNNKEINKFLELPKTEDLETIVRVLDEYYDPETSKVRFGLETIGNIEEVRLFIEKLRIKKIDIYSKFINSF